MNQPRVFLLFAWIAVAALLWMQWDRDKTAANAALSPSVAANGTVGGLNDRQVPQAQSSDHGVVSQADQQSALAASLITVETDVFRLILDGQTISLVSLIKYPESLQAHASPVTMLKTEGPDPYTAITGWASHSADNAPLPGAFKPEQSQTQYRLADHQATLAVPFIWLSPDGVRIRRTFFFDRGRYAIRIRDEVMNASQHVWRAYIYRKLQRVPTALSRSMSNPDSFSFNGVVSFSPKNGYERLAFKDFGESDHSEQIQGGWFAFLQHHFFTAWIPQADQPAIYLQGQSGMQSAAELRGPEFSLAPGQTATTQARLWVGPKLVKQIQQESVPGLDRVVDYSRFSLLTIIGQGLFWILSHLYDLFHNWGWSIIGLVVLLRAVMYPLTAAQYKSSAKMRQFQPRLQQLKERFGEDRQKLQQAMMELYRKEKINPMGGCLPIFIQMPIFFALYWVLVESVELRQAPWLGWIHNLTARDPYFVLPLFNIAIMWVTQKLTPAPAGMDPMSARMMQFMPIVFGLMTAFVPSGLALYWVVNGALNLLIQWLMIQQHGESAKKIIRTNASSS